MRTVTQSYGLSPYISFPAALHLATVGTGPAMGSSGDSTEDIRVRDTRIDFL